MMKAVVAGISDPVVAIDLSDDEWTELRAEHDAARRAIRKPLCTCEECGHALHPKASKLGTRFFAHNPGAPDACSLLAAEGESPLHLRLKTAVYRTAKRTSGWTASVEVSAPEADPLTGRPSRVDVVAERTRPSTRVGEPSLQGWEVQLSATDVGQVRNRQQIRERWLDRCTWLTTYRPSWAEALPWYRVSPKNDRHEDLVVDGVSQWREYDDRSMGGDYFLVEPFPAEQMVRCILRGAVWTPDTGWLIDDLDTTNRPARDRPHRDDVRRVVADYCGRLDRIPEYARSWTDDDWARYAVVAYDRLRRSEHLTVLDQIAIDRCPWMALPEADEQLPTFEPFPDYDHLLDVRPCLLCGSPVAVSVSVDLPIHHRCAWHVARGEAPPAPGAGPSGPDLAARLTRRPERDRYVGGTEDRRAPVNRPTDSPGGPPDL